MPNPALRRSDFLETYAVHAALRAGLKSSLYRQDKEADKAARKLLKHLESPKSIYGRQHRMIKLMQKGATVAQICKGLKCSRRTVFRYFHDLAAAGIEVEWDGNSYSVGNGIMQLVR